MIFFPNLLVIIISCLFSKPNELWQPVSLSLIHLSEIGEKSAQATIPDIKQTGHQSLIANKKIPADKLYFLVQEKQKEIILLSVPQLPSIFLSFLLYWFYYL